jgi:hypothetical protein
MPGTVSERQRPLLFGNLEPGLAESEVMRAENRGMKRAGVVRVERDRSSCQFSAPTDCDAIGCLED